MIYGLEISLVIISFIAAAAAAAWGVSEIRMRLRRRNRKKKGDALWEWIHPDSFERRKP